MQTKDEITLAVSTGDSIFCYKYGVGVVKEIDPPNEILLVYFLESKREEPIGFTTPGLKVLKELDPEMAVPRELLSNDALREQRKRLAGLKTSKVSKASGKRKTNAKASADAIADKILQAALKGETIKLKDCL